MSSINSDHRKVCIDTLLYVPEPPVKPWRALTWSLASGLSQWRTAGGMLQTVTWDSLTGANGGIGLVWSLIKTCICTGAPHPPAVYSPRGISEEDKKDNKGPLLFDLLFKLQGSIHCSYICALTDCLTPPNSRSQRPRCYVVGVCWGTILSIIHLMKLGYLQRFQCAAVLI